MALPAAFWPSILALPFTASIPPLAGDFAPLLGAGVVCFWVCPFVPPFLLALVPFLPSIFALPFTASIFPSPFPAFPFPAAGAAAGVALPVAFWPSILALPFTASI